MGATEGKGRATRVLLATMFRAIIGQKHRHNQRDQCQPSSSALHAQDVTGQHSRAPPIFAAAHIITGAGIDNSLWLAPKSAALLMSNRR
jgi:hypothetical protein